MKHDLWAASKVNQTTALRLAPNVLQASALSLCVAVGCLILFLPPLVHATTSSPVRTVLTALILSASLLLHWAFLTLAARRLQRSTLGWVSMSALLFPIGSVAALVLLSLFSDETSAPVAAGQS